MREFYKENGQPTKVKMSVEYISFSAHADFDQTKDFIEKVKPGMVVLVHGEKHEAQRLKQKLDTFFESKISVETPENWESVEMSVVNIRNVKIEQSLIDQQIVDDQINVLVNDKNSFVIKRISNEQEMIENNILPFD